MIKYLTKALMRAFAGFLLGMAFYFSILLIYWQFALYQTADIVTPMTVLNENNEVGDDRLLRLEFEFTKYTEVNPIVSRNIICADDTVHFVFSEGRTTGTSRPVGTFTARPVYVVDNTVPLETECYFQFTNVYQVNPIRIINKIWLSEPFIVKE